MKYSFKCCQKEHLYMTYFLLIFLGLLGSLFFIGFYYDSNMIYVVVSFCLFTLPFIFYFLLRLIYPYKYVIDDVYITKYRFKKMVFRIKIKDVKCIGIRKKSRPTILSFLMQLLNEGATVGGYNFDQISFLFEQCEIVTSYNREQDVSNLKQFQNDGRYHEYIDLLSIKKAMKLSELINVPYKIKKAKEI